MTTVAEDVGRPPSSGETNVRVPQQLLEANELLKSINRRLEDCALEWQAEISRKQWQMFNSKAIGTTRPTERSLLARTYFTQKNLDEAFKHLLSCNKIFSEYLNDFIDLLRGGDPPDSNVEERDVRDQRRDATGQIDDWKGSKVSGRTEWTNRFPSVGDCGSGAGETIRDRLDDFATVRNSFTDVIKAKLDFDTKFLGFEAALHRVTSMSSEPSCLCQYSSNNSVTSGRGRELRSATVDRRSRTITKPKRLTGAAKTRSSRKRKREKPSTNMGDSGDRPLLDVDQDDA